MPGPVGAASEPLSVYVPAAALGPLTGVAEGSAIVGPRPCGARGCPRPFAVCYEGNLYGAANLQTFAARARQAAGRLREDYPTVARALVRAHDVVEVGLLYEPEDGRARIELVRDAGGDDASGRGLLARWLGVAEEDLAQELGEEPTRGARGQTNGQTRGDNRGGTRGRVRAERGAGVR